MSVTSSLREIVASFPCSTGTFPLSLQLLLQLGEEPPVGALSNELLGTALEHPGLVLAQGEEAHRILGVIFTPLAVCPTTIQQK
jgi:hypothetical protein